MQAVVKMEVRGTLVVVPPTVTSVVVASAPQSGDTYRSYETIVFTVTFSEPVRVTPGRLRLKVGLDNPGGASGSTVEAVFSGLSQSQRPTADTPQAQVARHMHFEYKVQLFDRDVTACASAPMRCGSPPGHGFEARAAGTRIWTMPRSVRSPTTRLTGRRTCR